MKRSIYSTCVLLSKKEDFLKFLSNINVPHKNITSTAVRGDYILYSIDLTELPERPYIWNTLNKNIPSFIK